ncbi:hypothetical protein FE772_00750 [Lysobacter enzymogenes]|nr:hypothetical protein [Lysobacter enzymogenes]QCW24413.1 hypothetical protein FE772_00750 [Lysobacter enzymogenes]
MRRITFTVTNDEGIAGYWVTVGDIDLIFQSGKAEIRLAAKSRHALMWWMVGLPGKGISIVAKDSSGAEIIKVEKSKIPTGESQGGGGRRFDV